MDGHAEMHERMAHELRCPVSSDVDYTDEERVFMLAMQHYKEANRRLFPTWREVLAVALSLGYRRVETPEPLPAFQRGTPPRPLA